MASLTALNTALAQAGIAGEVAKADGVYYLVGPAFTRCPETCLHAVRLSQLSTDSVVIDAHRLLDDVDRNEPTSGRSNPLT